MRRRRFIAVAGTTLFGGCLSRTASDGTGANESESNTQTETDSTQFLPSNATEAVQSIEAIDGFSAREGPEDPFETATVGDGVDSENNQPHQLVVWNDGGKRVLDVFVQGGSDGPEYESHREVPADGYLRLELTEQVQYTVTAGTEGTGLATFTLGPDVVDCNDSRTVVRVASDGSVSYSTMSTTMACGL